MFSLRYAVEEPLATVLTAAAEDAYQRVASLLWALKRAEHSLGAAWVLLNAMQRQLARLAARARREGLACPGAPLPTQLFCICLCTTHVETASSCQNVAWQKDPGEHT